VIWLINDASPPLITEPFVKLARTILHYRDSIEAAIEWGFTNGIAEANIIWSLVGGVFHVADGGCRCRGGRVLWRSVFMVADKELLIG
jgi:hypothetical protein